MFDKIIVNIKVKIEDSSDRNIVFVMVILQYLN